MNEFSIIDKYFRPLTRDFAGAVDLRDDAGYLPIPPGHELVVTKDLLVENVHFFENDDPGLIAQKSLRVNLSDLAAKGAVPLAYSLGLVLPKRVDDKWLEKFTSGLAKDQKEFGIHLLGGDTTAGNQLTISVTAYGLIPSGQRVLRGGAKPGDLVFATGTIGDAGLGLKIIQHSVIPNEREGSTDINLHLAIPRSARDNKLIERYYLPQPRVGLIRALCDAGAVNAAIDVSDGLMADLRHILVESGAGGTLYLKQMPVSAAAQDFINHFTVPLESLAAMGDDYEIVFTSPAETEKKVQEIASGLNIPIHSIGQITDNKDYQIFNEHGQIIKPATLGYQH